MIYDSIIYIINNGLRKLLILKYTRVLDEMNAREKKLINAKENLISLGLLN